jgi:polyisoprenoid-binding protein YceI
MKKLLYTLLIALFANAIGYSQSYYTESGTAVFHSKVPLHTFSGSSENLTGLINLEDKTVDFYLDLATLDTGNGKRDKDMRLTLDVENHPFGEFFGTLVSDFDPLFEDAQPAIVEGTFKIHGNEQEVRIEGELTRNGDEIFLNAGWILRLEDYDIVPPSLLFVKVDQEQEIEIEAVLTLRTDS